ncbi:ABC transporter ATP-binding protein [Paenibacillus pasadenensis]|uniref:ABC transporter ATP-binding protein n=1 Tax=Paenibacillus pasadenensis TaxID=217090 RepID=UPI0020402B4E|nr:ABC transporter ATP-binding protein [Paenibacillus pasadenensis]MCM3747652.1 ABC transporter ATP-binding protein [Paenibacillus pasadenensis]
MATLISARNIHKTYKLYAKPVDRLKEATSLKRKKYSREFNALSNVSIEIGKGEIVGIIGKNGSGKSTLLKIITGVVSPTSGSIEVNGKISALLELGAGFNLEYTGMENIYLNGMMLGFSKEEMSEKIEGILAFADIGEFIHQPVKAYSSGMFARLAFSVAINVDPDILIVDEALAVGDLKFQIKCMEKFNELRSRGKTILFVSHDINSIKRYCHRAIWINEGLVVAQGHTETICDRYTDYLKYGTLEVVLNEEKATEPVERVLTEDTIGYIESFVIKNAAGEEVDEISYGECLNVEVEFVMNKNNLHSIVVGIAIHTIDNIYVSGLNTLLDQHEIKYELGSNRVRLIYNKIILLGGSYTFDVALFEANAHVPIDYKAKVKSFFVKSPYVAEGLIAMEHHWE